MDAALIDVLGQAGKPAIPLAFGDGGEVLVMPYGGRVLGLFPPAETSNFLWTNPLLSTADSARAFFGSDRWQNLGGDRSWLAPEVEYFFPRYPDYGGYQPPRSLDGSDYSVATAADSLTLAANLTVLAYRARVPVSVRITKTISAAANPLPERGVAEGIRFAGYTLRSTLERIEGPGDRAPMNLWTLCQLPHGGDMLIPTIGPADPTVFFGDVGPDEIRPAADSVLFRMRTKGEHKIGIKAGQSTGRIGYLVRRGQEADLLVRTFEVGRPADYMDGPPTRPADVGYAVEACNVSNPDLGHFAEMEHLSPAAGASSRIGVDVSQVWAFRGPVLGLLGVANALLGRGFSS